MELNVKGSGATKSFSLKGVEASLTVGELKKKCQEECGLQPDQQRLFLKGKLLKDEDTLEVLKLKVGDKATLFLVKGASGSPGSPKEGETKEAEKKEETPAVNVLCVGGCGFYGTAKTENYCSKCYAKKNQQEQADVDKARKDRQESEKAKEAGPEEPKEGEAASGSSAAAGPEMEKEEQKDKTKCWFCGKKCGLTGFECRCGYVFCSKHRYAEDHDCDFDHKGKGREILAKNNPNISLKGGNGILDGI